MCSKITKNYCDNIIENYSEPENYEKRYYQSRVKMRNRFELHEQSESKLIMGILTLIRV